jgi:5-methyltetrahydrofolate--homocysteine methyltransferase
MSGKAGTVRIIHRISPAEVLDLLDRRALFAGRWGYKLIGQRQRLELESRLAAMWGELSSPGNWSAGAAWSAFDAESNGGRLVITGVKPDMPLAVDIRRIRPENLALKRIVLQAVTLGAGAARPAKVRRGGAERMLWHGLAAETAEALAEWCSLKAAGEAGWRSFIRISPGFPAWPELAEQRKIFRLLQPGRIGIRLKRSMMMEPEYSTTAALFPI